MTTAIRLLTGLILFSAGLVGASSLHPDLTAALGWQAVPQVQHDPVIESGKIAVQRAHVKEQVIRALLEGDLGLFEAAAWFRELNQSPSDHPDEHWRSLPGRCDGEKLCRQVIGWARGQMEEQMTVSQMAARVQEMEEELEAHIACHGKVILPTR
jgi:hypothetical protein